MTFRNEHPVGSWEERLYTSKEGWCRQPIRDTYLGHLLVKIHCYRTMIIAIKMLLSFETFEDL